MIKQFNLSSKEIAEIIEGQLIGKADLLLFALNRIDFAAEGEITFYSDTRYKNEFEKSNASCIIVGKENQIIPDDNRCLIVVEKPYQSFLKLIQFVENNRNSIELEKRNSISPKSTIDESVILGQNVYIGENVVIFENTEIGDNVKIYPNTVIMQNCKIESNSKIYPNVTIYPNSQISSNVIIHAGAVIGSDGFGYLENQNDGSYKKIAQIGNVIIQSDVEIGANTTIDCSLVGSTYISKGSKIDNLVQIGHNVVIGENTGIASQVGIAGTCKIGNRVRLGGQVGLAGHLEIADKVTIIAQSGVSKSINQEGTYFGSPAKEVSKAFRIEAVVRKLPELDARVSLLEKNSKK
jgi:UDP-3-O-[3-hydroxymyristoyl] glucosamine N-acyltransferase